MTLYKHIKLKLLYLQINFYILGFNVTFECIFHIVIINFSTFSSFFKIIFKIFFMSPIPNTNLDN
jgi:hypothetical protein